MIIETVWISTIIILGITCINDSGEEAWCVAKSGKLKRAGYGGSYGLLYIHFQVS
jgi:hypothetical protein